MTIIVLLLQYVYADHLPSLYDHYRPLDSQYHVSASDATSSSAPLLILPEKESLPTNTSSTQASDRLNLLVMGYYPDWAGSLFPPEKIDFDRFDWIDFAFALPDETFNLTWDDPEESPSILSRLAVAAHGKNSKIKLSIGGWSGSK
jgi:chitinase